MPLDGPVHVIGAGLLGTSIGLALRRTGVEVWLSDADSDHVRTAAGLGAGVAAPADAQAALVVVAVPPGAIADVVAAALMGIGDGVVTDVGSVKGGPLRDVAAAVAPAALARYVGGHPMAGSERSGPLAASAALFDGRPWAVTPHPGSAPDAVEVVGALAQACGASVVTLTPELHDSAVARTSHLPHLMAVLVAGQLAGVDPAQLALSGQGVRDVTRIAGGDPGLWGQIIAGNAEEVRGLLGDVRRDLDALIVSLADGAPADGGAHGLDALLRRGNVGTAAIPGKHGGAPLPTAPVYVAVPDHPGELSRLFGDVGEIGTNIEDVRIDHDPGRPVGQTELSVAATVADALVDALAARGWTVWR